MSNETAMPTTLPWFPVRILWLLTGVTWAVRSAISFTDPEYRDPSSAADWSAVLAYSAAWLLTAPSVLAIGRMARGRNVLIVAWVAAGAAALVGFVNAVEDGLGVDALGTPYVASFLVAWIAFIPLAATAFRARFKRVAAVCIAVFLGIGLFPLGGGMIVLLSVGSVAFAPHWYAQRTGAPPTELAID